MQKLNRFKIFFLALFHLLIAKKMKKYFHFKTSPLENIAIGVAMTKIKYFNKFLRPSHKANKKLYFIDNDIYN